LLSALLFNGCSFGKSGYEKISADIDSAFVIFGTATNGHVSQDGYYVLSAYNADSSKYIYIVFPSDDADMYYIPYDNVSGINLLDKLNGKRYSASVLAGEGEIYLNSKPDSIFRELSGTFYGVLVNILDYSDTVKVENGEFDFLF